MGARAGAIPSAVGGRTITLLHVGRVFEVTGEAPKRWRGWIRHILRDQGIWVVCSLIGIGAALHDVPGVYPERPTRR